MTSLYAEFIKQFVERIRPHHAAVIGMDGELTA